jgi:hypothetical protein
MMVGQKSTINELRNDYSIFTQAKHAVVLAIACLISVLLLQAGGKGISVVVNSFKPLRAFYDISSLDLFGVCVISPATESLLNFYIYSLVAKKFKSHVGAVISVVVLLFMHKIVGSRDVIDMISLGFVFAYFNIYVVLMVGAIEIKKIFKTIFFSHFIYNIMIVSMFSKN